MKEYTSTIRDIITGDGFTVVHPVNLYECKFGEHCFVGPFVEIQKGVTIGNNTRIQSHCFICELVIIGDDCFISHGVIFINDTFQKGSPSWKPEEWKKTIIGHHVSIGSNATILPVEICNNVVIGAGSVVTRDIKKSGIYAGNPVKLIRNI